MVGQSPFGRPLTLKQAKKAYQRSSVKKLSAKELAVAERRATLEERASRIREKEARKKENARKRGAKREKERALSIRMGKEAPKEGGIKIGPSQLDLGRFLPPFEKKLRLDPPSDDGNWKLDDLSCRNGDGPGPASGAADNIVRKNNMKEADTMTMSCPPKPSRKDSLDSFLKPIAPASAAKAQQVAVDEFADLLVSNTQIEREISPPTKSTPAQQAPKQLPLITMSMQNSSATKVEDTETYLAQISTQDLDFAFTQIEPASKLNDSDTTRPGDYTNHQLSGREAALPPLLSRPGADDFNISTQDLDLSDIFQPGLDSSIDHGLIVQSRARTSSFDFGDDFSDHDLDALAEELESQSSNLTNSTASTEQANSQCQRSIWQIQRYGTAEARTPTTSLHRSGQSRLFAQ